jgi:hypothetical protein
MLNAIKVIISAMLSLCLLSVGSVFAEDSSKKQAVSYNLIDFFSAELLPTADGYLLNAESDIAFGVALEQAVQKGFDLHFILEFQLLAPRKYWFDEVIASVNQHVTLRYHALSRQYLVIREDANKKNQQKSFATLAEAEEELAFVSDFKVLQNTTLKSDTQYKAILLMRLDKSRLPKAFQVDAINSNDWKMTSQRFEWQPQF